VENVPTNWVADSRGDGGGRTTEKEMRIYMGNAKCSNNKSVANSIGIYICMMSTFSLSGYVNVKL